MEGATSETAIVFALNPDGTAGNVTQVSPAALDALGRRHDEIIGGPVDTLLGPADEWAAFLEKLCDNGYAVSPSLSLVRDGSPPLPVTLAAHLLRGDGDPIALATMRPLSGRADGQAAHERFGHGKPEGSHAALRDRRDPFAAVTLESEHALRLAFAMELGDTGAFDLDLVEDNLCRSLRSARILGHNSLQHPWNYHTFLDHVIAEDREMVNQRFRQAVETRSDWQFECRVRRADGKVRWIRGMGRYWQDEDLTRRRMAGVIQDITDRKMAELALRELTESLETRVAERTAAIKVQSDRLRRLAAELSLAEQRERKRLAGLLHDQLQQLLVAARMRIDRGRRHAGEGRDAAPALEEAEQLIQDALEASRSLTAELHPPTLDEGGLTAAFQWLADHMRERYGLVVDIRMEANIGPADEAWQALLFDCAREALFNVVKHAGVSEATLTLARPADGDLLIRVEDGGVGFDMDAIETADINGFGLFSMTERLESLGGAVAIDSRPGDGARVEIRMPLKQGAEPGKTTVLPAALGGRSSVKEAPARAGGDEEPAEIRVLLVDDHQVVREGIAVLVDSHPRIQVVGEASSAEEAFDMVVDLRPNVVVMDVNVPGMNGIEATWVITRQQPETHVIGLSMHHHEYVANAVREAGAKAFVRKDAAARDLLKEILACAGGEPA